MNLEIKRKYLVFPVNTLSSMKKLTFKNGSETVYQLNIKIDNINPNFYAYIDVSRFIGQILELSVMPEMMLEFEEKDEMLIDNVYNEKLRPQVHFTTKNGWINDPNGLIYLDGVYHMFYQHNPAEPEWENMHWGHAVSKDLIHWEEKESALFPDERGHIFSGSAILDDKNVFGKNVGDKKCALLFYTTTSPIFEQHMSYSMDNFKTIIPYKDKKAVVPHIEGENRDPKIIYCDELDCYIMALYLVKDGYCVLKSDNLVDWTELQRVQVEGDDECPDFFPITDNEGNRKWVFMGADDKYLVGSFQNGQFVAEQPVKSLRYGIASYAGQSFSNLPNGRIVRIVWDRWNVPYENFSGQMGIPMEMSLDFCDGAYYLQANPIEEVKSIYATTEKYSNVSVTSENTFSKKLENSAQLLKIQSKNIENGEMNLGVFGRNIKFDFSNNKMSIGDYASPITVTHKGMDLTIIVDRCSMEIFADGGKIYFTCLDKNTVCDYNIPYITIETNNEILLENIEINSLDSIWRN